MLKLKLFCPKIENENKINSQFTLTACREFQFQIQLSPIQPFCTRIATFMHAQIHANTQSKLLYFSFAVSIITKLEYICVCVWTQGNESLRERLTWQRKLEWVVEFSILKKKYHRNQ